MGDDLVQVNNMKHATTRNPDYTVPFSVKKSDEVQNNEREKSEQVRLTQQTSYRHGATASGSDSDMSKRDLLTGILPFNLQNQLFQGESINTSENRNAVSQQNRLLLMQNQIEESERRS